MQKKHVEIDNPKSKKRAQHFPYTYGRIFPSLFDIAKKLLALIRGMEGK